MSGQAPLPSSGRERALSASQKPEFEPLERHESVCAEGDIGISISRTRSQAGAQPGSKADKKDSRQAETLSEGHDSEETRAGSEPGDAEKSKAGNGDDPSELESGVGKKGSVDIDDYPEGGLKAWASVAGTWTCIFWSFGFANTWGVFQAYYSTSFLSEKSADQIAWISSFQYFLIYGLGLFCGRAFDLGLFKPLLLVGIFLWAFCLMMVSLCTEYWQFFLAQGLGLGLAFGMCFNLAVALPTHYFHRRRAFALGIQASGSSVGGTVLPIMVSKLIPRIGFGWTVRLLGFMGFAMMLCGWAVMETRLPPLMSVRNGGWRKVKWFDLSAFKTPSYTLFCVGATTLFLGLYNLFTYVETFGNDYQIPATTYLLPILNAASTFGRIIPGFYADKIGRFNMLIPTLFGASIVLYFWPLAKDLGGILPILILYGAFSGTYVSIIPSCLAQLGDIRTIGTRTGMCFAMISLAGLVSTPIGGVLVGDGGYGWTKVAAFSASVALAGTFIIVASRQVATHGKIFVKF